MRVNLLVIPFLCTSFRLRGLKQICAKSSNQLLDQTINHAKSTTAKCTMKGFSIKTFYTFLFLFIFSSSSNAYASPINKQTIVLDGPYFQGWLLRTIDHENDRSIIVIAGSFSASKSLQFDEHYAFAAVSCEYGEIISHNILDRESVKLSGLPASFPSLSSSMMPTNVTWSADGLGYIHITDSHSVVDFRFKEFSIKLNTSSKMAWDKNNRNAGPEGWLGYTSLLPCHYWVHSVGSEASYEASIITAESTNPPDYGHRIKAENRKIITGNGFSHIEGNHGSFFPSGWIWSQSIAAENKASLSVVGGRFQIGGISPMTWVIYVRFPPGNTWIFRTTTLDHVAYDIDSQRACVRLLATSLSGLNQLRLHIYSPTPSLDSFGPPVYTPTKHGFSNIPGCRENYRSIANITVLDYDVLLEEYVERSTFVIPLTALEFGGEFIGKTLRSLTKPEFNFVI